MPEAAGPPRARRVGLLIESDGPGGAEQVVAHLAESLASRGDRVWLFVPRDGEGWLRERLRGSSVMVEELPLDGPLSWRGGVALAAALQRHGIDLLHTHEFGESLTGASAARWLGIPHVLTLHGGGYWAGRARRRAVLRLAIALSGAVTAVAPPLARDLRGRLNLRADTVEVVLNGARPPHAAPARALGPDGIPEDAPLLLAVGNLYPVKGHRHLITALQHLRPRHPELHLAIAGRGDEEGALRAQAREAGLSGQVHFLGLRDDIGALLERADLFVHPSLSEGLPLAVLEAMLAARPIIASAVGAIPAVLDEGEAGRLVPPGDPGELAAAIEELLDDPAGARRLATRAGQRARREYSVERMVERYRAVYDRLLVSTVAA